MKSMEKDVKTIKDLLNNEKVGTDWAEVTQDSAESNLDIDCQQQQQQQICA